MRRLDYLRGEALNLTDYATLLGAGSWNIFT